MKKKIIKKEFLYDNIFSLSFENKVENIKAGQFVNILIPHSHIILRRPFSIAKIDNNIVTIIVKKIGIGTEYLSRLNIDDEIDVLYPLGTSFDRVIDYNSTLFIAGGIGIAGISLFINRNENYKLLFGDKNGEYEKTLRFLNLQSEYIKENEKGFVTDFIDKYNFNTIFACGPFDMFKSIKNKVKKQTVFYAISEEIMACGIGLCNGCIVEYNDSTFRKVCTDGPVLDGMRIKYD